MSIRFANERDEIKGSSRGQRTCYLEIREIMGYRNKEL